MRRFFVEDIGDTALITGEDLAHLSRVLRLNAGDALCLCDGRGWDYDARIERIDKGGALCRVLSRRASVTEPACRVTLYQCLPKAAKLETVIQKCTELGIYNVVPVVSRYCVAEPGDFEKKRLRCQRIACEAAKQSQRGRVPDVEAPIALDALPVKDYDLCLLAYEQEKIRSLRSVLRAADRPQSVALIVGPEGGFDESEAQALISRGALSVSLGSRILRTETAGPAMLAQVLYEVEP